MRIIKYTIITLFLFSCTMAPDLELPKHDAPKVFKNQIKTVTLDSVAPNQWWKNLDDPLLVQYIDTMLINNLDLGIMVERLKQLEAIADIAASSQYPTVNMSGSASDSKSFMVNNFVPNGQDYITIDNQTYGLNFSLIYNLDIWGKMKSLKKAALNEYVGMRHDLKLFYQTMIIQTITAYVEVQSLKESIALTQRTVETYKNDFDIQERRYRSGIGTRFNVALAKQMLTANEAKLAAEEQAFKQRIYQLSLLLGQYPSEIEVRDTELSIDNVPTTVPSKMIEQRHDIQKSYYSMEAARYRVGAAKADFYPQISLTASTGWNTSTPSDLFKSDLLGQSVGVNVSQNIFSGLSTQASLDKSWAEYRAAMKTYQKTVLEAFKDVELALVNVETAEKQFDAFKENRVASSDALRFMQKRYTSGISDYQQFMDVKRSDFTSEANLITAKKNKLLSRVNLILKLGGNW